MMKKGTIVETCSLMPGIVTNVKGDDIEVLNFSLQKGRETTSYHSLKHCGIVEITQEEATKRLIVGRETLEKLWSLSSSYEEYIQMLNSQYELIVNPSEKEEIRQQGT